VISRAKACLKLDLIKSVKEPILGVFGVMKAPGRSWALNEAEENHRCISDHTEHSFVYARQKIVDLTDPDDEHLDPLVIFSPSREPASDCTRS
jgi:hypothetical protein